MRGDDHLSSSILWRILEAFRSIIPMLKFLHGKNKNKLRQNYYSTHYSPSKLRRAYKRTSKLAFGAMLPHCLLVFCMFSIFFCVGGVQQLLLLWHFFTSCQDRMCLYLSWGVLVAPQLLCEHEVKTKKNFGYTQVNQIVWPVVIVFKFFKGLGGGGWKWVGVLLWGWGPHASQTYPKPQLNNLHYFAAHMPLPPQNPRLH